MLLYWLFRIFIVNFLTIYILHYLCSIFLAGHWKILGRGGAVKTRKHPCYCCAVTTEELAKPSHTIDECNWCRDYILKNKISPEMVSSGEWVCFHRPIITDELKSSLYEQLKESQIIWKDGVNIELDVVRQNSQLNAPHDFEHPTLPERNDSSMICLIWKERRIQSRLHFLFLSFMIYNSEINSKQ